MRNVRTLLSAPYLCIKALYFYLLARWGKFPYFEFDSFGRKLGFSLLGRGKISGAGMGLSLILNPVSSVRYFEFDFVKKNLGGNPNGLTILDVSSPYLFGIYTAINYPATKYLYVNADVAEIRNLHKLARLIGLAAPTYQAMEGNAVKLSYSEGYFDAVISISVIEHVNGLDDGKAMAEMWRVLKVGGTLNLTFMVAKNYEEEFRKESQYNLPVAQSGGEYFFQRFYDKESVRRRLLDSIHNFEIIDQKIWGEKENGFFKAYEKRWMSDGLSETVKDPAYMHQYFDAYEDFDGLKGIGIMCIALRKR